MIRRLIEWCMRNPLLVVAAALLLTWFGWDARQKTPVDAIPDIGENQVIVFVDWPGRSPRDVQDQVVDPLSRALSGIPDKKDIRSNAMFGFGYINIIFKDGVDFYWARTRVLEKLNEAAAEMPEGVVPVLGPDGTGIGQIFWYTLENGYYCPDHPTARYAEPGRCPEDGQPLVPSRLDLDQLRSQQDWYVRYYLEAADGVAEVASVGGYVRQYQVDVDPARLLALNVALHQVYMAVRDSNIDVGAKVIEEGGAEFLIRGLGFVRAIEDIENIVVTSRHEVPVYVKNVATVALGPDFRRGALDRDGVPAVGGVVLMRYHENPLRVIDNVKKAITELEPSLPPGVRIVPFYDRTALIRRAQDTLDKTLIQEIVLTVGVILLFLGTFRPSVLIALVLPIGMLMAYLGMWSLGIPANIMSLAGIAIAIGVMVDAGIAVAENMVRRLREMGPDESPMDVAVEAAQEVGPAIFFAILIIVAAFIPVFALTGQSGKMFRPLALTKTFAMLGAAIVSVTLLPILCAWFLKSARTTRHRWVGPGLFGLILAVGLAVGAPWPIVRWLCVPIAAAALAFMWALETFVFVPLAGGLTWLVRTLYTPIIRFAVTNRATKGFVVLVAAGSLAATSILLPFPDVFGFPTRTMYRPVYDIGREFMPPLNEGDLLFMPVLLPGASLSTVKDVMAKQDLIMRGFPEVASAVGKLGRADSATDPAPVGMLETIISIRDPEQWPRRHVRADRLSDLVHRVADRLVASSLLASPPADVGAVAHEATSDFDRLAVEYNPAGLSEARREHLYRTWLVRLILERLLTDAGTPREGGRFAGVDERRLQQLAGEMVASIDHGRLFRRKTRNELINQLTEATRMPGVSPIMTQPIRNRIDMLATGIQTPIGIKVYGPDLGRIEEIALGIEGVLKTVPGARGPYAERIGNKPYLEFGIDRAAAARYGIDVGDIQRVLMTAVGGMNLTTTVEGRERYPIRVRYKRELRDNIEALRRILVAGTKGVQVPLEQVVRIVRRPGPAKVASENTILFTRVFCDVDVDQVGLVDFADAVEKALDERIKPGLPPGYFYSISGQYEAEIESRDLMWGSWLTGGLKRGRLFSVGIFWISIALILGLLWIKFHSPSAVVAVFSALLFAALGAIWLQFAMGVKFSTAVTVGYIALFGVAVEDGIVFIEFLLSRVRAGLRPEAAAVEAGILRVRPILMTTATTVLALLPIMLYEVSTKTGAELMQPIAVPTFAGMITCTLTNLIVTPVLFCVLYPLLDRRMRTTPATSETAPTATPHQKSPAT